MAGCRNLTLLLAAVLAGSTVVGQEPTEDVSSTQTPFTLKIERNEVPVRVVVRDLEGRAVRNLTKDSFRILDDGKPQEIVQFSAEGAEPAPAPAAPAAPPTAAKTGAESAPEPAPKIANRFVALYFDDLVVDFEGMVRTRQAASNYLQSFLQPNDRVAIATSSGRGALEFTGDRDKLQEALARLKPNGLYANVGVQCPDLSDYEAYLIAELDDPQALGIAAQKVINCRCNGDAQRCPDAIGQAMFAARQRWSEAEMQSRASMRGLEELVRRLSVLPGQRIIVFISSGFISDSQMQVVSETIDRAVRTGVVVNALDSRGLYVIIPGGDASQRGSGLTGALAGQLLQIQMAAAQRDADILAEIADGTGGVFYHNNNDFDAGFRSTGGLAQFSYVLTFSPNNLKRNGKYHHLTIQLVGDARRRNWRVQARQGYFAPRTAPGSPQFEQEELSDAVFSRDEINKARVKIGTRFYKSSPTEAHVTVVAHLDPQWLSFRKEKDRHLDNVTFVTVVFDSNGNYVDGTTKTLEMHVRDATLEKVRAAGISVLNDFKVAPGTYLVREVVRDAGGLISSLNSTLEIPY